LLRVFWFNDVAGKHPLGFILFCFITIVFYQTKSKK